jgi:hypothetical protein
MPFPDATIATFSELQSYIAKNKGVPRKELIIYYDLWMDKILKERGYGKNHPFRHYMLTSSFLGPGSAETTKITKLLEEGGELPPLTLNVEKPYKEKKHRIGKARPRVLNEKGQTKKAMVRELVEKGRSLEFIQRRIIRYFPEAKLSTVKTWYHRIKNEK